MKAKGKNQSKNHTNTIGKKGADSVGKTSSGALSDPLPKPITANKTIYFDEFLRRMEAHFYRNYKRQAPKGMTFQQYLEKVFHNMPKNPVVEPKPLKVKFEDILGIKSKDGKYYCRLCAIYHSEYGERWLEFTPLNELITREEITREQKLRYQVYCQHPGCTCNLASQILFPQEDVVFKKISEDTCEIVKHDPNFGVTFVEEAESQTPTGDVG